MKFLQQGCVNIFFILVVGFISIHPVGATGGGSFEIPEINEDFNQGKQGPAPAKETSITKTKQEKGFFDKMGNFFSNTWEKTKQGVKKATDWTVSKAKGAWNWLTSTTVGKIIGIALSAVAITAFFHKFFRKEKRGGQSKTKNTPDYSGSFDELWKRVGKQYPLAFLRFHKKNLIENVLVNEKNAINAAGEKYDVPPEIIAAIIVKEQITQSAPDELLLYHTMLFREEHSAGLGAVFPSTAKKAWVEVDPAGAYLYKIYGSNADIQTQLIWHRKVRIDTIAVVLNYYARQMYKTEYISNLTLDQWKRVVGRYNATSPSAQKKYSDYVYDYLDPVKAILK
ncbi:MAG: hypothetical protein WB502_07670 [Thermoactinomyces sp.]